MRDRILRLLTCIVVPALVGLTICSVQEAYAACSLSYVSAIDEWQSNSAGSFGTQQDPPPDVDVTWTSSGQAPWVLYASDTPGNSENLATQSVTPATQTITVAEETSGGGDKCFTITGSLSDTTINGLYELSNWDGTHYACSGSHQVTILKP